MTNKKNTLSKHNFANNLRKLRKERGLTIEEFAFQIDKSPRLIYDYESDLKFPSLDTLIEIAEFLGVEIDSILRAAWGAIFLNS